MKINATFFFEFGPPFAWPPGKHDDPTMFRVWCGWFAFGWLRIPFKEFCETEYVWQIP